MEGWMDSLGAILCVMRLMCFVFFFCLSDESSGVEVQLALVVLSVLVEFCDADRNGMGRPMSQLPLID